MGETRNRLAGALVAMLLPLPLLAPPAAAGELVFTPGLTSFQSSMGSAIDVVCPRLLAAGFATASTPTGDLTRRCREMRQTANANQSLGPTLFSLGLDDRQLGAALGLLAPEEAAAQGTTGVETGGRPSRVISARLGAIRRGGRGAGLSELPLPGGTRLATDLDEPRGAGLVGDASGHDTGRSPLGAFLIASWNGGDTDPTRREAGFDFDTAQAVAGVDYRFGPGLVAGLAFLYSHTDADFDSRQGGVNTDTYGLAAYATWYSGALYVDLYADFSWSLYETTRRIVYAAAPGAGAGAAGVVVNRTARGDTDGPQGTLTLGAGYEHAAGGGFTLTPFARVEFVGLSVDGYRERGADGLDLELESQSVFSLQSILGLQVTYAISVPWGVVVPQVRGDWRHEFLDQRRLIRAKYAHDPFDVGFNLQTDRSDRDFFSVAVGVVSVFRGGVSAFLNWETLLGLRNVTTHSVAGGVRIEF